MRQKTSQIWRFQGKKCLIKFLIFLVHFHLILRHYNIISSIHYFENCLKTLRPNIISLATKLNESYHSYFLNIREAGSWICCLYNYCQNLYKYAKNSAILLSIWIILISFFYYPVHKWCDSSHTKLEQSVMIIVSAISCADHIHKVIIANDKSTDPLVCGLRHIKQLCFCWKFHCSLICQPFFGIHRHLGQVDWRAKLLECAFINYLATHTGAICLNFNSQSKMFPQKSKHNRYEP